MGSGESKSGIDVGVFGDLDISSGFVLAGSELRGRAYVRWNPGSRVDPRTTYRVCVSVIGEEAATVEYRRDDEFYDDEWNEGPSTRRTRQITDYANATTRFLSQVLVLRDLGPRDGKVDLVFPFSFTLPPRLPTSMEHSQGRSRCSISYYALVQIIDLSSNAGGLSAGNKEHRMNFSVYNPPAASGKTLSGLHPTHNRASESLLLLRGRDGHHWSEPAFRARSGGVNGF